MTWTDVVFERLKANCLEVVCHVPDSVLGPLITRAEADPFFTVVPLTREEEGVGVLTGAYLGGRLGSLMMQVSGLGNSVNGLASLAIPYQIPFLMLISQRGELGEFNAAQIAMGRGAGLQHVAAVTTMSEFEVGLETWLTEPGPWLVVAKIDESPAPTRPPKDPVWIKLRFMETVNK